MRINSLLKVLSEKDKEIILHSLKHLSSNHGIHKLWNGNKTLGYGILQYKGIRVGVHRWSCHIFHNLDLDSPLSALHKPECIYKNCWNPDCLYIGNDSDNAKDLVTVGRHHEKIKTHCPLGHEYSEENTYTRKSGKRVCKKCRALGMKRNKDRKKVGIPMLDSKQDY